MLTLPDKITRNKIPNCDGAKRNNTIQFLKGPKLLKNTKERVFTNTLWKLSYRDIWCKMKGFGSILALTSVPLSSYSHSKKRFNQNINTGSNNVSSKILRSRAPLNGRYIIVPELDIYKRFGNSGYIFYLDQKVRYR